MKTILISIITFISIGLAAQSDPEAKDILDRVSEKTKSYKTLEVDFILTIENRAENLNSKSQGNIKIKGDKYLLESMGTTVYFDGTTLWSFMEDINEVTITEPDSTDDDFIENPSKIFSFYDRDFKFRLVGETKLDKKWMYEIDLYPKNLNQPYSRFKLFVVKDTDELYLVNAIGKDGIDYSAMLQNPRYNQEFADELFKFNASQYPDIEIVDMR